MLKLHFFFLYSEDLVKRLYNNRKENFTGLLHLRSNWAVCVYLWTQVRSLANHLGVMLWLDCTLAT